MNAFLAASIFAVGCSQVASAATLIGDTVNAAISNNDFGVTVSPGNAVVGAGDEFFIDIPAFINRGINVDVGDNFFTLTYNLNADGANLAVANLAFTLSSLDFGAGIKSIQTSFTNGPAGNIGATSAGFTSDSVTVFLDGGWDDGAQFRVELSELAPIPLPAGAPLVLTGIAVMGLVTRKRRKRRALAIAMSEAGLRT